MRNRSASIAVLGALVTVSCLSETLVDTYRDGSAETNNTAGAPADPDQPPILIGTPSPPLIGGKSGFVSLQLSADPNVSAPQGSSDYLSTGFWQTGSVMRLHFGVTARDHVVALSEVRARNSGQSWVLLSELSQTGAVLRGLELRSGPMPDVFRLLSDGSMVFAGVLNRDVNFGRTTLSSVAQGYYVVKLDADWNEVMAFARPTLHAVTLQDIAISRDGSIYLASDRDGIMALDSSGNLLHEMPVRVLGARLATDEQRSSLVVAGWFSGSTEIGTTSLVSRGARDGVVFTWDESSRSISSVWQFGGVDDDAATSVAIADNGDRVVGGLVGRKEVPFGAALETSARGAAFVAQVDANGQAQWTRNLGEDGRVSHVASRGVSVYVAAYSGTEPSTPLSAKRLLVTKFSEAGTQTAFFAFDRQLALNGRLGVDSSGVLWLSAFAQTLIEGNSEPQSVTAIYRMAPIH